MRRHDTINKPSDKSRISDMGKNGLNSLKSFYQGGKKHSKTKERQKIKHQMQWMNQDLMLVEKKTTFM